jgi:hypothetical protein
MNIFTYNFRKFNHDKLSIPTLYIIDKWIKDNGSSSGCGLRNLCIYSCNDWDNYKDIIPSQYEIYFMKNILPIIPGTNVIAVSDSSTLMHTFGKSSPD